MNKYKLVLEVEEKYDIDLSVNNPISFIKAVNKIFKLGYQAEESFVVLGLDVKGGVVSAFEIARGSLSSAIVCPREIFKRLVLSNSHSFCVAHNHPSGNLDPSDSDIRTTKALYKAGELLGIALVEHLIVFSEEYISLRKSNEWGTWRSIKEFL